MERFNMWHEKGTATTRSGCRLAGNCLLVASSLLAFVQGPNIARAADLQTDASKVMLQSGDRPIAVYQYAFDSHAQHPAKPFVASLCSPGGVHVLRDSPSDHKHHHGLMFAVAVDGVDFWSENPTCGKELDRSQGKLQVEARHAPERVTIGPQSIDWTAPSGKALLRETRRICVRQAPDAKATLVTWQTQLAPAGTQAVKLTGATYFGLGMRFVQSMDTGGRFVNADGKTGVSETNNARSAWCAYSASAEGKPVTVAMFDAPSNVRHPATWFTMDQGFAYLAATLDLSRQPLAIEPGKPLELCYHVAVWDGTVDAADVAALYRQAVAAGKDGK